MPLLPTDKFKFHTERVKWSHERKTPACFICKKALDSYECLAIRGQSWSTDLWLRDSDDSALLICGTEVCFNMVLLNAEKYIRLAF